MRIVTSCIITSLIIAATLFAAPSKANAWDQFIIFLAKTSCQGKSNHFKNGCFAYLDPRVNSSSSENESLERCKTQCNSWYRNDASGKTKCHEGCQYLRNQD